MIVRSRYDIKKRSDYQTNPRGKTLTQQNLREAADINEIMKKYMRNGIIPETNPLPATYADLSHIGDYQEHMNKVQKADQAFMALPAELRAHFLNDPKAYVDFAVDPENLKQMQKWGLAETPEAPEEPVPAPPAPVAPSPEDPTVPVGTAAGGGS